MTLFLILLALAAGIVLYVWYAAIVTRRNKVAETLGGIDAQYHSPITFGGGMETGNWMADFMNSYAWTIAGGSDEVQRNIIAERLVGMPREPKSWTLKEGAA